MSTMTKIEIREEAMPLIKSGLLLEKNVLKLSLSRYQQDISDFEKRYRMKSRKFLSEFNSGKLGDDAKWFDWLFAYKAVKHVKEKLRVLNGIYL